MNPTEAESRGGWGVGGRGGLDTVMLKRLLRTTG